MRDASRLIRGQVRGQPRDQLFHRLDAFELRGAVLPGPAIDLPRDETFVAAEIREADRRRIDGMDGRDHAIHLVVDGAAFGGLELLQRGRPENASRARIP